jgi:hypothetical protein
MRAIAEKRRVERACATMEELGAPFLASFARSGDFARERLH